MKKTLKQLKAEQQEAERLITLIEVSLTLAIDEHLSSLIDMAVRRGFRYSTIRSTFITAMEDVLSTLEKGVTKKIIEQCSNKSDAIP